MTSAPLNTFEPHLEEMCFPDLYPLGCNGLSEERYFKLTNLKYFQSRILNKDKRWRQSIPWLFWALNTYDIRKVFQEISIVCGKT